MTLSDLAEYSMKRGLSVTAEQLVQIVQNSCREQSFAVIKSIFCSWPTRHSGVISADTACFTYKIHIIIKLSTC